MIEVSTRQHDIKVQYLYNNPFRTPLKAFANKLELHFWMFMVTKTSWCPLFKPRLSVKDQPLQTGMNINQSKLKTKKNYF